MSEEGSAQSLARVEFATAMRGYDKDEVDTFLRELAEEHNRLLVELAAARRSSEKAHLELGEEIGELLQHAKDIADGIVKKAREEAATQKEGARRAAEKVAADAKRRADEVRQAAESSALTRVRDAQEKVTALQETEVEVRARLATLLQTIRSLDQAIEKAGTQPPVEQTVRDDPGEIAVLSSQPG